MATRRDLLHECNDQKIPIVDFDLAFCKRCYQPDCTRSIYGTMKFDQRVATWHERLFSHVPRMDPADPRASEIQAKLFQMVEPPIPGVMSGWDDPRVVKSSLVSVPDQLEPVEPQSAPVTPEPLPPRIFSESISQEVVLINTPLQRNGIMLVGGPSVARPNRRDSWDAPVPLAPGETLVKNGATIRFGGGVQSEAPAKNEEGGTE